MKSKTSMAILLAVVLLFVGCDCSTCEQELETTKEKLAACEDNRNNDDSNETRENLTAFNSYNGYYNADGLYIKKIMVPHTVKTIKGKPTYLRPEVNSNLTKGINASGTYVLLEILEHGKPYYEDISMEPLLEDTNSGLLATYFTGFDPTSNIKVYVVSIHDEEYASNAAIIDSIVENTMNSCSLPGGLDACLDSIEQQIQTHYQQFPIVRPKTVGGGIVPPK
jgi:hypothetical protein